jgi:hypothetical protein
MGRARLRALTIAGLLLIVLSMVVAYDLASPAFDLTVYAPDPLGTPAAEFAAALIVYLAGAALVISATRSMGHDTRETSASLVALLAIGAIPVCALLGFYHYWTEIFFVVLTVVLIVAPIAFGFRRVS